VLLDSCCDDLILHVNEASITEASSVINVLPREIIRFVLKWGMFKVLFTRGLVFVPSRLCSGDLDKGNTHLEAESL
jgi:hypothetical protein